MAVETVRTIRIRGQSDGLETLTAALNKLKAAQEGRGERMGRLLTGALGAL